MKTQFRNSLRLLILLLISNTSFSQEGEQIQSDRPGQANSANTVGSKNLQIQMGFNHSNLRYNGGISGSFGTKTNSFSPLFRIGVLEKTEIAMGCNYASNKNYVNDEIIGETQNGLNYSLNIRQNILDGKNNFGILAGFNSDFKKNIQDKTPFNLAFQALSSHTISDRWGLSTNLNYNMNIDPSIGPNHNLNYVLNLGFSASDKIGFFIENYGQMGDDWRPLFDGGLGYLLSGDFQLDISAGFGPKYDTLSSFFIDFGLSYRIKDIFKKGAFKG